MRLRGITSARVGADVEGAPVETASAALPPRSRRVPARFVVAVACVAGVAMSVSSAQGVTQPQPLTAQTVPQAVALAHSTGQPVVVVGALNGYNQVQANPDGTLSATMSAEPVRAADAGSATGYAPIDTTLSVEGGAVSPALTSVPTQFSIGGSGAAVVSSYASGEQVSVGSMQPLPAPTLTGDTATYANITAGVFDDAAGTA